MKEIDVKYKVDEGVPVPVRTRAAPMPLDRLEVSQSILFPVEDRARVQSLASRIKRRNGKEFTVKKINEQEARVWRTK